MSNNVTINSCMNKISEFCSERDWDKFHNPKDLAIGISTEAGELLDLFRFKSEEDFKIIFGSEEKFVRVEEELADIVFFVFRFAQMNNIDIEEILDNKLEKNASKYPADLVKGKNLKYNEY